MTIIYKDRARPVGTSRLSLVVENEGLSVTVRNGPFRVDGKDYQLAEDMEHEITVDEKDPTSVLAYLVEGSDGSVYVLVDELVHNGLDRAYRFDDGSCRPLHSIFHIHRIPPGTEDLADQTIEVDRLLPAKEPVASPARTLNLEDILKIAKRGQVN